MRELTKEEYDQEALLIDQNVANWQRNSDKYTSGVSEFDSKDDMLDFVLALHRWGGFVGYMDAEGEYVHWISPVDDIPQSVLEEMKK